MKRTLLIVFILIFSCFVIAEPAEETTSEEVDEDFVTNAQSFEDIDKVFATNDPALIGELDYSQISTYGLENIGKDKIEHVDSGVIDQVGRDEAQSYFSGDKELPPGGRELKGNELALWEKTTESKIDDKIRQIEGIKYGQWSLETPEGTKVNFEGVDVKLSYTEDGNLKVKVGDVGVIVREGKVTVNPDGTYGLSSGGALETEGGDVIKAYIEKDGKKIGSEGPVTVYTSLDLYSELEETTCFLLTSKRNPATSRRTFWCI